MSYKPITRSQTTLNPSFLFPPLVSVYQSATSSSQSLPSASAVTPIAIMAQNLPKNFVTWDNGSPLISLVLPTTWAQIPFVVLKVVPKFTKECSKTAREHLQDIANICIVHSIIKHNVALRLLVVSFKGRALDWYISLTLNSICSWDQLGDHFFQRFSDKADRSSLMHQLITIKRTPQEALTEFNLCFQRTWE